MIDPRLSAHIDVRFSRRELQPLQVHQRDPSPYARTVEVTVNFGALGEYPENRRDLHKEFKRLLDRAPRDYWLSLHGERWRIDCDKLREAVSEIKSNPNFDWLHGVVVIDPEYVNEDTVDDGEMTYDRSLEVEISPETLETHMPKATCPVEISDSLARFQKDHPDPAKAAFIMMRFGKTKAHGRIVRAVRDALQGVGIVGLRADDKEYHGQILNNIQTYMHGCGMGVAIFERLQTDEFNPNVSLELGYMMALQKPVCLLKDNTVSRLATDIVGNLYRSFDPQSPEQDIKKELVQWLKDKSLISAHVVGPALPRSKA